MAPEWIYLLKVNAGIVLFYAFYKLFFQRDTFFRWRRYALLGFLGISLLYPSLDIREWVNSQEVVRELTDYYASVLISEEVTVTPAKPIQVDFILFAYWMGVAVLSLRFLVQLGSIFRMRREGTSRIVDGQRVISLPSEANPFSFFGWIFVHLPSLDNASRREVLLHEQAHVRQWHSLDVVFSELVNIFCWFNPFMWLMKNEIRLNLEYLADEEVTETVSDFRIYQYHLLGLSNPNRQSGLYNNFNVSHLKRRIIMMNKKRTCTTSRLKYALFAPLAFALLLAGNISCTSSQKKTEDIDTLKQEVKEKVQELVQTETTEETVFMVVEEMPEFPGGAGELMKFIRENVKYPAQAHANGIQGRVIVQFVVETDGTLTDAIVVRGVDPLLDAEALRVIKLSPKWKPGKQRGQAVRVKYTVPVMFRL